MPSKSRKSPDDDDWVTLEEAARRARCSVSTLRSWYRSGQIQSRIIPGARGRPRQVLLSEVKKRRMPSVTTSTVARPGTKATKSAITAAGWQDLVDKVQALTHQVAEVRELAVKAQKDLAFLKRQSGRHV